MPAVPLCLTCLFSARLQPCQLILPGTDAEIVKTRYLVTVFYRSLHVASVRVGIAQSGPQVGVARYLLPAVQNLADNQARDLGS